jgi:hypothetical protein
LWKNLFRIEDSMKARHIVRNYRQSQLNDLLLIMLTILVIPATGFASDKSLAVFLPVASELGQDVSPGYLQSAAGEDLVELINGGAVLFFRHGFRSAVQQEFYVDSSR